MLQNFQLSIAKSVTIFVLIICVHSSFSQTLNKGAANAFIITRMVDKFHVQPRALNDTLSNDFYNQFLYQLDGDRTYFTENDITQFSKYRFQLNNQIKQQKTDFLKLVATTYLLRLHQADTMIDNIAKKPFNFSGAEKFTEAEDTSYPADIASMHTKLYKKIKLEVLDALVDVNDEISSSNTTKQKQLLDSAAIAIEKKTASVYKRNITRILQSPGGFEQFVADEYCKALSSCYDPHTEFFPLTEEENFEGELGNQNFRFGFSIKEDNGGGVLINSLEPGSPAFKCGLLNKGDKFQTLQWEGQQPIDVSDADARELTGILSQSNHDKITITVKKSDGTLREVSLQKEQADADEAAKVKSLILKGSKTIGYISLPAFYSNWENESAGDNGCANDVAKEILKLKQENISGLILDLRYNGGGSIKEAVELAGIFIDAGPVAQLQTKSEPKIITLKDVNRGTIYDGPLLILVNGYSASASEILAGTLQDYNRALIVGSTTYGKATGQIVMPLDTTVNMSTYDDSKPSDNYLKITTDKLFRITGKTAQFSGVTPDILLPDFLDAEGEKESDDSFALKPSTIDANKYYKSYPALAVASLNTIAKQETDTMQYFKHLQQYIHEYKTLNTPGDASLNLKDAINTDGKSDLSIDFTESTYNTNYAIQNNAFDLERLKTDPSSKDMYDSFLHYLTHDPYLKISYDLLCAMSK